MKLKPAYFVIFILFFSGILCSQTKTLKFDMKYQIQKNNFVIVNDSTHHRMGLATGTGNALFSDGTNAGVSVYFIYDYTGGNGNFAEYDVLTFADSSTITIQSIGQSMGSVQGKDPLFSAIVTVIGGTGAYNGYTGEGSMTGNRQEALKDGVQVKLSFNVTLK